MSLTIPQPEATAGDTSWFTHDRFGLFIHWGLYALPARHEWVQSREKTTAEEYDRYFRHFDPDLYDPKQWARAAAGAGMKYFVVTTKHHEGFCLFDSQHTDFKSTNTLCGRDLLRPMVDAFREHDMRVGFYHSLLDWRHPHYTIDRHHPRREDPDAAAQNEQREIARYAEYLYNQTEELLSRYGTVDVLWYDFSFRDGGPVFPGKTKEDWQSERLIELIRKLQPNVVLNDRLQIGGDIKTPEQFQPREWVRVDGKPVVWEACQTFSGSWGYYRDEESWKSVDQLVQMLIDTVSKGGNLLLNVGPTGRGEFDHRALDRLAGMGEWMKRHSRSIYGCTQAPAEFGPAPQDCRYTYHSEKNRLYLHVFTWPFKNLHLDGMADRVEYAQLLSDASEVRMRSTPAPAEHGSTAAEQSKTTLTLELPVKKPPVTVPVIELFLK